MWPAIAARCDAGTTLRDETPLIAAVVRGAVVDWRSLRREFPILQRRTYLNTCSLGALSRRVRTAVEGFLETWDSEGAAAWYSTWLEELDNLRARFATLIGARPAEVAVAPSVSAALGTISSCVDYLLRSRLVTSDLDFPTVAYQWSGRREVKLDFVSSPDGLTLPPEAFADAIDTKTALVATSHVLFTTGYVQDLRALADMAHERGAYLLVDAYQSAGQVPLDVRREDMDILITGGLKWLLGGPGAVYMYVRKELVEELEPLSTGWFANVHQFDFDPKKFEFHPDARRFEAGTPSMAAVCAGRAGLDLVLDIGPEQIHRRTRELSEGLIGLAQERGLRVRCPSDPERRSAIVVIERPKAPLVVEELRRRNFIVDQRGGGVRISPYFYNLPEENEAVLDALEEVGTGDG